jgi:F420-dependent hydroxymycolic acid dehydrogenase
MRRSGEYGDGLITDPETWRKFKSKYYEGTRAANKEPAKMPVLVEQFVVVGTQRDAAMPAELWRFIPKAFKTYFNISDPKAIQEQATAENPLQKVYGQWPISDDPDVHVKAIMELFRDGVTIVNIHSGQADQRRVIEFYGDEVLPRVHRQLEKSDLAGSRVITE